MYCYTYIMIFETLLFRQPMVWIIHGNDVIWFSLVQYAAMFKVINCHDVPIPDTLSPIGREFIRLCLQRDPAKRPSASTLLCHPFVQLDRFMPSNRISLSEVHTILAKETKVIYACSFYLIPN